MSEYKNTDSIIRNLNVWMINHYATGMSKSLAGRHYSFAQKLVPVSYTHLDVYKRQGHTNYLK